MTRFIRFSGLIAALALGFSNLANAGPDTETDRNDVILAGHDVVAYFTEGEPVVGSANYTATYNGAIYRFSTEKNRDSFRADPARYAPQYGGFCAYGMTFGKKFEIDGKAFKIVEGKLYVNKNLQVAKEWVKDIPGHITEADGYWPRVENTPASEL